MRTNIGYREFGSVPGYDHQVGIAVPFKEATAAELPSPAEDVLIGEVEETIASSLEGQAESLFVAVITTGRMREFVFYTREPQRVKQRFEELRNRITSHEIQLTIQSDKTWRVYAQLGLG